MSGPIWSLPAVKAAAAGAGFEPPKNAWAAARKLPRRNSSRRPNAFLMESNIEHLPLDATIISAFAACRRRQVQLSAERLGRNKEISLVRRNRACIPAQAACEASD